MQGDASAVLLSLVPALICHICHLHSSNALPDASICATFQDGNTDRVTPSLLTAALCTSCSAIGNSLGLRPHDISARALRASRDMASLWTGVDPLIIRMVGHWKSWAMVCYLHQTATTACDLATWMLKSGNFAIATCPALPADAATLVTPLHVDKRDHQFLVNAF